MRYFLTYTEALDRNGPISCVALLLTAYASLFLNIWFFSLCRIFLLIDLLEKIYIPVKFFTKVHSTKRINCAFGRWARIQHPVIEGQSSTCSITSVSFRLQLFRHAKTAMSSLMVSSQSLWQRTIWVLLGQVEFLIPNFSSHFSGRSRISLGQYNFCSVPHLNKWLMYFRVVLTQTLLMWTNITAVSTKSI